MYKVPKKSNFPSLGFCSCSVNGKPVPIDWKYSVTTSGNTNDLKFQNCIIDNALRYRPWWPHRIWPGLEWPMPDPNSIESTYEEVLKKDTERKMYPPYNVVEISENLRHIEYAVAGMDTDKIEITTCGEILFIEYNPDKDDRVYKSKGISTKKFRKELELDEYWEVEESFYKNGILTIVVIRNIPDDKKYRTIKITHT